MNSRSRTPGFTGDTSVGAAYRPNPHAAQGGMAPDVVVPQGCNWIKKIACGAALATCAVACVGTGGTACLACLSGLGMSTCADCV